MARYVFSYEIDGDTVIYEESSPDEDKMDISNGAVLINFTGNGYLKFWKRCMNIVGEYERIARAIDGTSFADIVEPKFVVGIGRGTFTDLWYGDEKIV